MKTFIFILSILLSFQSFIANAGVEVRSQNVSGEQTSEVRDCLDQKIRLANYSYDFIDENADPSKCMLEQHELLSQKTSILEHLQKQVPKSLYNFSSYIQGWKPSPWTQYRPRSKEDSIHAVGAAPNAGGYQIRESDEEKMFSELLRLKNINVLLKSYMFANRKPFDLVSLIDTSICPKGIIEGIEVKSNQQKEIFKSRGIKLRDNFKMSFGFKIDLISAAKKAKELISKYKYFMEESNCRAAGLDPTTGLAINICDYRDKPQADKISIEIKKVVGKYPSLLLDRKTGFWSSDKIWEDQPWIDRVASFKPEGKEVTDFVRMADKKMKKKVVDTIHSLCMTPQEEQLKRISSPDKKLSIKAFKSHELISIKSTVDELLKEYPDRVFKFKDIHACMSELKSSEENYRSWKVLGTGIGCGVLAGALAYSGIGAPLIGPLAGSCAIADVAMAVDNYQYFEETYNKVESCHKSGTCSMSTYEEVVQKYNSAVDDVYYSVGSIVLDGGMAIGGTYLRKLKSLKENAKFFEEELKSLPIDLSSNVSSQLEQIHKLPFNRRVDAFEQLSSKIKEVKKILAGRQLDPSLISNNALKMIGDYFELPPGEIIRVLNNGSMDIEGNIIGFLHRKADEYKSFKQGFEELIDIELRDRLIRFEATNEEVLEGLSRASLYSPKDDEFKTAESVLGHGKTYEEILLDSSISLADRYGHAVEVNSLAKILRDHPSHSEKILDLLSHGTDAQKQFIKDLYTGKPKNYTKSYMDRYMSYVTDGPKGSLERVTAFDESMIIVDNNVFGDLLPGQDKTRADIIKHFIGDRKVVSPPSVLREETNLSARMQGILPTHHDDVYKETLRKLDEMGIGEGSSSRYKREGKGKGKGKGKVFAKDGLYDQRAMAEVLHSGKEGGPIPTFLTSDHGFIKPYLEERLYREITENRAFREMLYGSEGVPKSWTKENWLSIITDCLSNGCRGSAYPIKGKQLKAWREAFFRDNLPERKFYTMLDDIIKRDMKAAGMSPTQIQQNLVMGQGDYLTRYPCGIPVHVNGLVMNLITVNSTDLELIRKSCGR